MGTTPHVGGAGHALLHNAWTSQDLFSLSTVPPVTPPPSGDASPKLFPPRGTGRLITRDKLITLLRESRRKRCFVLQGPAGYGKTSLLVSWRQEVLAMGYDVAWLSLGPEDNEITHLLDILVAAFAQVDPAISSEAAELAGYGIDSASVERMVVTLVRGIARHPRPIMLVLDDMHHLEDARIHQSLQWLIDYEPENLKLFFSSRSSVPLSFARLRSQDLLLELDLRDLRFTPAESEQFLKAQIGSITPRDAALLHELTDGWAAGLQLYAIDWKKKRRRGSEQNSAPADGSHRPHLHNALAFSAFFEEEVLSQLSAQELELLIGVSVCNRFCASLCAALGGRPEDIPDVLTLVARLEADNLFIIPVESAQREPWYRLHPLLKETLRARFEKRDEASRRRVHRAAWEWFRDRGLQDEAVSHAVLAADAATAADLVEASAQSLAVKGELRKIISLVRQLPQEVVLARPRLRLWLLRNALYSNDFEACLSGIVKLRAELHPDDAENHFALVQLEASLAVQRDDTAAAMALLDKLQRPPRNADVMTIGSRDNVLSWLYLHRGEYERARLIQLNNPSRLIDGVPLLGTSAGTLLGRCLIGLSLSLQGHMTQAERVYRNVLFEAERAGGSCNVPASLAATLLGEVLYELNEPEAVRQLLEHRVDILEKISIPDSVLRMLYMLAASHWIQGNRLESFAYLERLDEYAIERGTDRLLTYSLAAQVQRHLELGQTERAHTLLLRLETLDKKHLHADADAYSEASAIAARVRIRWLISQGDLGAASEKIQVQIPAMESKGRLKIVAQLLLLRALVESRLGQASACVASVIEALRLGQRLGLLRSLLDTDPSVFELIRLASQTPSLDPVVAFYSEKLLRLATALPAAASRDTGKPEKSSTSTTSDLAMSEREMDILRLLAQALPNKKIARALSLAPETIKWHLKNIYAKLGVSSRDDAVARMRALQGGEGGIR